MNASPSDEAKAKEVTRDLRLVRYSQEMASSWNEFVSRSKNGTFLFDRGYMDYHSDRFEDASLMVFEEQRLIALMPASVNGTAITSHGGLTFGGVVTDERMRNSEMLCVFKRIVCELRSRGLTRLIYKAIPHIYHRMPAEEDLYTLFRCGAVLKRRDVASCLRPGAAAPYTKGRKYGISKASRGALKIERSHDFAAFMRMEEEVLGARHAVRPVHTAEEMTLLAGRFPHNIKLFVVRNDAGLLAGVIIYESDKVAHAQYIASSDRGRELCALDALLDELIRVEFAGKEWFDFGISTEMQGRVLNKGLSENKESYGARAVVYDWYEVALDSDEVSAFLEG